VQWCRARAREECHSGVLLRGVRGCGLFRGRFSGGLLVEDVTLDEAVLDEVLVLVVSHSQSVGSDVGALGPERRLLGAAEIFEHSGVRAEQSRAPLEGTVRIELGDLQLTES